MREPLIFLLVPVVYWQSLAVWVPGTGWEVDIMHQLRSRGEFMGRPPARPSTRRPRLFYPSAEQGRFRHYEITDIPLEEAGINLKGQSMLHCLDMGMCTTA